MSGGNVLYNYCFKINGINSPFNDNGTFINKSIKP